MYKFSKKEVSEIIGVSKTTMSKKTEEEIKLELQKNCYKLIKIEKEWRTIYYYCEYEEYEQNTDEHLKEVFKVRNVKNFKTYTKEKVKSIEEVDLRTRKEICNKTNTAITTSKNYDKKLLENNVLEKLDDVLYICVERKTGNKVLVDKKAYNEFWYRNRALRNQLDILDKKFFEKEITMKDLQYLRENTIYNLESEYMYYQVSKIAIKYDNYLYKLIME
ncbi:MAG: hypothetical protein ACRC28_18600 [Clostridium sp.]|uniref:hypothetical protein n=1 Tax=Clostridium sp. TaxID=1506 RepID=UPI003F2B2999